MRPRTFEEQGASLSSAASAAETVEMSREQVESRADTAEAEPGMATVGPRAGERKRQLEAKKVREAALRRRTIPSLSEATTTAQGTMARLLAKVKSKEAR